MTVLQVHMAFTGKEWRVSVMRRNVLTSKTSTDNKTFLSYDAAVRFVANAS